LAFGPDLRWSVKADQRSLDRAFAKLQRDQIPFATALALNEMAAGVRDDQRAEMGRVFDRPTPFTLNAFYVKKARKTDLSAWVGIRDFAPKGTPAWKYLTPEVEGGPRRMKRLELRLSQISGGQYIVPGKGAKLDQYGNISRGQIAQILSRLNASADPAQNMSDKTTQRLKRKGLIAKGQKADYFVVREKGGNRRPLGVYQLVGPGKVEPVLIFTRTAPSYSKRYDPDRVVIRSLNTRGAGAIERAIAQALATARKP
jgi:hypothetical protein